MTYKYQITTVLRVNGRGDVLKECGLFVIPNRFAANHHVKYW